MSILKINTPEGVVEKKVGETAAAEEITKLKDQVALIYQAMLANVTENGGSGGGAGIRQIEKGNFLEPLSIHSSEFARGSQTFISIITTRYQAQSYSSVTTTDSDGWQSTLYSYTISVSADIHINKRYSISNNIYKLSFPLRNPVLLPNKCDIKFSNLGMYLANTMTSRVNNASTVSGLYLSNYYTYTTTAYGYNELTSSRTRTVTSTYTYDMSAGYDGYYNRVSADYSYSVSGSRITSQYVLSSNSYGLACSYYRSYNYKSSTFYGSVNALTGTGAGAGRCYVPSYALEFEGCSCETRLPVNYISEDIAAHMYIETDSAGENSYLVASLAAPMVYSMESAANLTTMSTVSTFTSTANNNYTPAYNYSDKSHLNRLRSSMAQDPIIIDAVNNLVSSIDENERDYISNGPEQMTNVFRYTLDNYEIIEYN